MEKMTPEMVREYRARYEGLEQFEWREARHKSVGQILALSSATVASLANFGGAVRPDDDLAFAFRWAELQRLHLAHPSSS